MTITKPQIKKQCYPISFFILASIFMLMGIPQNTIAAVCDYSKLIEALAVPTAAVKLHNCRIEVVQQTRSVNGEPHTVDMIYAEDKRLNTVIGIDIWSQNECEYKYDRYANTYYYYDDRIIGPVTKRRSIKFSLNRQNEITEFEIGIKDINSWKWTSRVLCKASHYGDEE